MSEWRNKEFKILRESMPHPTCITKIMPWEELLERCRCCIINVVQLYNINPYPLRYLKASTWKVSVYLRDTSRNNQNSIPLARQPCSLSSAVTHLTLLTGTTRLFMACFSYDYLRCYIWLCLCEQFSPKIMFPLRLN